MSLSIFSNDTFSLDNIKLYSFYTHLPLGLDFLEYSIRVYYYVKIGKHKSTLVIIA